MGKKRLNKKAPKVGLVARRGVEPLSAAADMNPALKVLGKDMVFDPFSALTGFEFFFST